MRLKKRLAVRCGGSVVLLAVVGVMLMMLGGCMSWFVRAPSRPLQVRAMPRATVTPESVGSVERQPVRVRLLGGQGQVTIEAAQPVTVRHGNEQLTLRPGVWVFKPREVVPARQRFDLFVKTFKPAARDLGERYVAQWKDHGYPAELVALGRQFETESGHILDNRIYWVSANRYGTQREADQAKRALESQKVWGWVRAEMTQPGSGVAIITARSGAASQRMRLPLTLESSRPITVDDVEHGFAAPPRSARSYSGVLALGVGSDGLLTVTEHIALEDYIAGVVPSEMPASWPMEALKAQAVAARSDAVANLSFKHILDGYDYCATEHCQMYKGFGARRPATDAAVAATRGEVLTDGRRVIPAVFSANCGGSTEDNETVWSGPPDPALRAVSDLISGTALPFRGSLIGMEHWLKSRPAAYCSSGPYFRWTRRMTASELTTVVNRRYAVGTVRDIELGARGPGGRLKWVKVLGSSGTVRIEKEAAIRLAFGGLPSAMFIVERERGRRGYAEFTFIGGGRGHGVGLCQQGARGRALAGQRYADILSHYFTGVTTERVR